MNYVLSTSDPEGTLVLLGKAEWQTHILARHPEVSEFLDDIERVIQKPDIRHQDPEDQRVVLFYGHIPRDRQLHPNLAYLLVVVKYVSAPERGFRKTGFVSSIYFLKAPKRRGESL